LSFQPIPAQSIFSGKIVDQNSEPIPFAHIRVENTNIGTVSNHEGVFKLVANLDYENSIAVISSIGYKPKKVVIHDGYQIIFLNEDLTQLAEVIIVAKDYGRELVLKAINAIPKNYPTTNEKHMGFFRETTFWENEKKPIYIAEAVIESVKKDYTKKNKLGDVKLIEFRKYESEKLDSLETRIYAGSHHIHRFDIVARRHGVLRNPDSYKFDIVDTLRQNGKDVYKISFKKKKKHSGHLYILEDSFAIVKAEIEQNSNFDILDDDRQFLAYTVSYEQGEDDLWRFMNSNYKTTFRKKTGLLNLTSEYVSTDVQVAKDDIPYMERLQFSEILLDNTKEYNPNFWNSYNIIAPNEISEELFRSIDYSTRRNTTNYPTNLVDFIKRISFEMGLTWTTFDIAPNNVSYTNSIIDIQETNEALNKGSLSFSSSIFYSISPYFMIGYANERNISRTGISSNDFVVTSNFNLNPKGRPITISPRVHFGFQKLNYFIQNFNLEEDIEIDGKTIYSANVDAYLSQRGFRLKPTLVLKVEQSKRISFLISTAYNFSLTDKDGILFREKDGFILFPRKVFLENGQENLSIEYNGEQSFENTVSINLGIAFKF